MRDTPIPSWSMESRSVRRLPYGARRRLLGSLGVLALMATALGFVRLGPALLAITLPWFFEPLLDRLTRPRPGRLQVVDRRLWLTWGTARPARATLSLGGVTAGWCEREGDALRVRLCLSSGDRLGVLLPDATAARGLLDALGVGPTQRAFAVSTARPWMQGLWLVVAAGLWVLALGIGVAAMVSLLVSPLISLALAVPFVAAVAGGLVLMRPSEVLEVMVGADGISVRGEVRERFYAYDLVQMVCADETGVALVLRDGAIVRLLGRRASEARRARLQLRVEEALAAHRNTPRAPTVSGLARGEASYAVWVASLRAMVVQEGVYRAPPQQRADFLRVIDNPHTDAAVRVAAALALTDPSGALPEEARGRVRIAAEATANDALRVALERTLDGEFDERCLQRLARVEEGRRQ